MRGSNFGAGERLRAGGEEKIRVVASYMYSYYIVHEGLRVCCVSINQ